MLDGIVRGCDTSKGDSMTNSAEYKRDVKEFTREIDDLEKVLLGWSHRCNELRRSSTDESSAPSEL